MPETQTVFYRDPKGHQRSGNLFVLLHAIEKHTGPVPERDKATARDRFRDFKARMNAPHRAPPRAAGYDAPPKEC